MNCFKCFVLVISIFVLNLSNQAQTRKYTTSDAELIFSWGNLEYIDGYDGEIVKNPIRFTCFFHLGQNYNYDFSKNVGFFTGYGLRNVGFITNEVLPDGSGNYFNAKIIRRTYSLGIPVALKFGSMKDRFFVYGGGELECAFAYKEKYWNSHSRSGTKSKYSDFFGKEVNRFLPSGFVGVQLPKGLNIKFKYYLTDFLNNDYKRHSSGRNAIVSDLTKYKSSHLAYIALTWQFEPKEVLKKKQQDKGEVASLRY
jgi:hypothetical protein